MSTLLECKDLTKCYGKKTAIDHINLAIESGHIMACSDRTEAAKPP